MQQADRQLENSPSSPVLEHNVFHARPRTGSYNSPLQVDRLDRSGSTNEADYLSVAAMGEPQKRDAFSHDPSFMTMVQEVTRLSTLSHLPSRSQQDQALPVELVISLDSIRDSLQQTCGQGLKQYAEIYGRYLGMLLPLIPADNWHSVLALASWIDRGAAHLPMDQPACEVMLCFSACLGLINSPEYDTARDTAQMMAAYCARQLPIALHRASDLAAVSSLSLASLLCLYLFDEASAWSYAGLALTKAISAGFHRANDQSEVADTTSTAFWSLYTLDRAFAVVLDRPLSVEDGDMTIQLPLAAPLTHSGQVGVDIRALSSWTVHYSHMFSSWKRNTAAGDDLVTRLATLTCWYDSCREIELVGGSISSEENASYILTQAIESQLTCRALVHLFYESVLGHAQSTSLLHCTEKLEAEVPQFFAAYKAALVAHVLAPTILDLWTIFSTTVTFVATRQPKLLGQLPDAARPAFAISVATMKVVLACEDLIRVISVRNRAVYGLQEVLWSFLDALEKSSQRPAGRAPSTDRPNHSESFNSAVSRCQLPIPRPLKHLMDLALTAD
ncbi:hypothetical protein PV08_10520 [Exophiala spinifera]|uniref:Xylanolytic transcriptional activator regulatory domain-containing protein n=1 Tax=Exophiala spinifera TaxID=91928 RepID=A0A0D2AXN6_9EURO|nr:uncharacterized protein PV08_10520 [Exophiala spinifera]KIW11220.1 hypothetical protein PV08_10520 [Exophiala spinifera]